MGADQKRAILAVILSGAILFGWQYFFAPIPVEQKVASNIEQTNNKIKKSETDIAEIKDLNTVNTSQPNVTNIDLSYYTLENENNSYTISNNLTVTQAIFKKSNNSFSDVFKQKNNNAVLINNNGQYEQKLFSFTKKDPTTFNVTSIDGKLTGTVYLDQEGFFHVNLNSSQPFTYKFTFKEVEEELEAGKEKLFTVLSDDLDTFNVGDNEKLDKEISWFGVDFNYHLFATVIEKKPMVYKADESGNLSVKHIKASNNLIYKQIFVKKEYDYLSALGSNLHLAVDFGIWSILAVPILRGLQFFYTILPNYGISIIILTLLIRMLTFPLQYKSFKSMKKMQDIQPELTKIREKFKSDPQKMQQETMALFKKAGANPLGGCLPLLLQMPIFFAFYRVLYSSVELVDAPFYFWIVDLSQKDPYYVLPILMALAMFFHQKLTPSTTADPTQKKILMFMPLIFAVFMKDFPAGLTLYIFVSTVVAMLQQLFVFKRT